MKFGAVFPQTEMGADVGAIRAYGQAVQALPDTQSVGYQPVSPEAMAAPAMAEANLGQVIDNVGDAAYGVVKAHQDKVDAIKGDAAINSLLQAKLSMTAGPDGYLNQKGPAAVARPADQPTIYDQYTQQFDDAATQIRSQLQNQNQNNQSVYY